MKDSKKKHRRAAAKKAVIEFLEESVVRRGRCSEQAYLVYVTFLARTKVFDMPFPTFCKIVEKHGYRIRTQYGADTFISLKILDEAEAAKRRRLAKPPTTKSEHREASLF